MGDLKRISHIQFNEFIKGKGFKGRRNFKLKDVKAMLGFKPLYDKRSLVIHSEDMEPTKFTARKMERTFLRTKTLSCFS